MFDSSAVIALLRSEPGADVVRVNLSDAAISSVNIAEIASWIVRGGETIEAAQTGLDNLDLDTIDFDEDLAMRTGALMAKTKRLGLSLGDRACLATAAREGVPVLTADRAWRDLDVGVEIQLIR
jgi:PIN domain nuclease of toxin-antitoxin system